MVGSLAFRKWVVLALAGLFFALTQPAAAEETGKRLALLIGNAAYQKAAGLPNAAADATAFANF